MSTPANPVDTVTSAVDGLQGDMLTVAGVGIGIGAAIFAVRKGWAVVRGLIR